MLVPQLAVALTWVLSVSAQRLVPQLSFGTDGHVSTDPHSMRDWLIAGEGHTPEILSDKVILTPPYGGGKRGSLWTKTKNTEREWEASLTFRVGGQYNGKGNLNLWYVKDWHTVSTASIYSAGKFDGLALVLDQNHGVQKIRGFLNDGSVDFRHQQNIDGLAFGHCDFNYRNRGAPAKLQVKYTAVYGLEVIVDGHACFSTNKVQLSSDSFFGVTAASSDPPDSAEVFKFETTSSHTSAQAHDTRSHQNNIITSNSAAAHLAARDTGSSDYKDLSQRLNIIEKALTNMASEFDQRRRADESRFNELLGLLKGGNTGGSSGSTLGNLEKRLVHLDQSLSTLSRDVHNVFDHAERFAKIDEQLGHTMDGLGHLPHIVHGYVERHTPRIGFIVFSFMAFQSCCLAILLFQKYRKSTMPKKYL